jgi:hypothetical protein
VHEQSETVQLPDGRWVNVYGRAVPKAGQQLPAGDRSRIGHQFGKMMPPAKPPTLADLLEFLASQR